MRIINYLILTVTLIVILGGIAYATYKFLKMPKNEQIEAVKKWLLFACIQAEMQYGGKTGLIKLRYVYDLFVTKFPWLAQVITFEYFSSMVDEALELMKNAISNNFAINNLITGSDTIETEKVVLDL